MTMTKTEKFAIRAIMASNLEKNQEFADHIRSSALAEIAKTDKTLSRELSTYGFSFFQIISRVNAREMADLAIRHSNLPFIDVQHNAAPSDGDWFEIQMFYSVCEQGSKKCLVPHFDKALEERGYFLDTVQHRKLGWDFVVRREAKRQIAEVA